MDQLLTTKLDVTFPEILAKSAIVSYMFYNFMDSSYLGKEQLFSLLLLGYVVVHVDNLKLNPG